jgi:hypothetical protein
MLKQLKGNKKVKSAILALVAWMGVFLLSLLTLKYAPEYPLVYDDEWGIIAHVRNILYNQMTPLKYWPGYAFLLLPIYSITNEITKAYYLTHIFNRACFAMIPILLYYIAQVIVPQIRRKEKVVACVIATLYPTYLVYTNLTLADSGIAFIYLVHIACLMKLYKNPSKRMHFINIFVFIYLLSVHPRVLAFVPAFILLNISILKPMWIQHGIQFLKTSRKVVLGICIVGICLVGLLVQNATFIDFLNNLSGYPIGSTLSYFFSIDMIGTFLAQFLYMSLATYGLNIMGIYYLISLIKGAYQNKDDKYLYLIYILFANLCLFLLSAMFMAKGERADHLIYGRYNEFVLTVLIMFGVIIIYQEVIQRKQLLFIYVSILLMVSVIGLFYTSHINTSELNTLNIMGIYGLYSLFLWDIDYWIIVSVFISILSVLYMGIYLKKSKVFLTVIGIVFVVSIWGGNENYYLSDGNIDNVKIPIEFYEKEVNSDETVGLPNLNISQSNIRSEVEEIIVSSEVKRIVLEYPTLFRYGLITGNEDIYIAQGVEKQEGFRIIGLFDSKRTSLRLREGQNLNKFIEKGYVLPENFPSTLEDEAYQGNISIQEYGYMSNKLYIKYDIEHVGKANFWPNLAGLGQIDKAVRILISVWDEEGNRIVRLKQDLPKPVYPGEIISLMNEINIHLESQKNYYLSIDLLQEGEVFFEEKGEGQLYQKVVISEQGKLTILPSDKKIHNNYYKFEQNKIYIQDLIYKPHSDKSVTNFFKYNLIGVLNNGWIINNGRGVIENITLNLEGASYLVLESEGKHPYNNQLELLDLMIKLNGKQEMLPSHAVGNKYYFKLYEDIKELTHLEIQTNTWKPSDKLTAKTYKSNLKINLTDGNDYGLDICSIYPYTLDGSNFKFALQDIPFKTEGIYTDYIWTYPEFLIQDIDYNVDNLSSLNIEYFGYRGVYNQEDIKIFINGKIQEFQIVEDNKIEVILDREIEKINNLKINIQPFYPQNGDPRELGLDIKEIEVKNIEN